MSVRSRVPVSVIVGVVLSLVLATQAWGAASAPTKLLGGRLDQIIPAANGGFLGWTQNRLGTHTYDAMVRDLPLGSDTPGRLNPGGSRGYMGGISQDSNEAIYEKVTSSGGDIWIVPDLTNPTAGQTAAPSGINTPRQEAFPTISDNYILFTRVSLKYWSVILFDRTSMTPTILASAPARCFCLTSGTVSDRYATWIKCGSVAHCNTFYYDANDSTTHVFPNPNARPIYGGTISDTTGYMYAVRSGAACGAKVKILRWQFGTSNDPVVISSFAEGTDLVSRLFVYNDGVNDTVYYDPASCKTARGDIYDVALANT